MNPNKKGDEVVGFRLRLVRKDENLTQGEMAEVMGVQTSAIGKIERGEMGLDLPKLQLIASHFKIDLNWLIVGIGQKDFDIDHISPKHVNNFGDNAEMNNIIGDLHDNSVGMVKEPRIYGDNSKELEAIKNQVVSITQERDMFKKLYEQSQELLNFYKNQTPK